jgi:hypothetical protein
MADFLDDDGDDESEVAGFLTERFWIGGESESLCDDEEEFARD